MTKIETYTVKISDRNSADSNVSGYRFVGTYSDKKLICGKLLKLVEK